MVIISDTHSGSGANDWRVRLLGENVIVNQDPIHGEGSDESSDEEAPGKATETLMPIQEALDPKRFDYIAVFIGADYCPHCKAFVPTVKDAAPILADKRRCKVLFLSNDRTDEAFGNSRRKNVGIDVLPYDTDKTKALRNLFDLKTIPALMILKNNDFDKPAPTVVTNARNTLVTDPHADNFPWVSESDGPMSWKDRLIIRGKYGKWYELGHHVNPDFPDKMYMDEHAVRARAGLINVVSWIAVINVFFWREPDYVFFLFPLVAWEFATSLLIGLTPISPFGVAGTLLAILLQPQPHWKPANPKRFAWGIGLVLSSLCFTWVMLRHDLGDSYDYLVRATVIMCNLATWFEASCGFCFGCFIYNTVLVPMYKLEECGECKL